MRIDLTCPIELWHCKMPTEDSPELALQVYNLSDQEINSIQFCVLCFDAEQEQFARHVERVQGIEIPARHAYEITLLVEEAVQAQNLEVIIEKAWQTDGAVWRRGNAQGVEYQPSPALRGAQLRVMQELAGPDATCYPSDQGAVWVCVCGRANAGQDEECRRCRRDKHELFTKLNEAAIEKIIFTRESAVEEQQHRQREEARKAAQEKEALRKRRRHRRRVLIVTAVCLLLAAGAAYGVYFHGIPYYRYYQATRALESNQYDAAREQFLAIGDYRDSADMALECDYRAALSALNGGNFSSLQTAWQGFDALGDYKDSALKAQEARYTYAEKKLAAGSWEEAIALYEEVPSYADARMKRSQTVYEWAGALLASGDYLGAREKYLTLGDYQNASASAVDCLYQAALAAQEDDPEAAIGYFTELGDYRDSPLRLQAVYYAVGQIYYDRQEYDTAAEYFLLAGDYSDAYRKATACLYTPAVNYMNAGDYAKAAEMLEKITGYQDSKDRLAQCYYRLGLALMQEEAYEGAQGYFELAAETIPQAETARKEAIYQRAMALLENGMEADAITLLASIPGYQQADVRLNELLYAQASERLEQKDYPAAIESLEMLGTYEDSDQELKATRLTYGQILIDQNLYEDAIEVLSALGDDPDAQESLSRARYLLAIDLKTQGNYAEAMPILEALGDYSDAKTQYSECIYLLAMEQAEEGSLTAAADQLARIPDYQDAKRKMQQFAYQAAQEAQEAGNLADAIALYTQAGKYQDAQKLAQSLADTYYSNASRTAKEAMAKKEYKTAIDTLGALELESVPEKYKDLPELYREACYQYAESLYNAKLPFDALVYYKLIPDYKDVSTRKLTRIIYRIMGTWTGSNKNTQMVFREDGTCRIEDQEYAYVVGVGGAYALSIGSDPKDLTYTYNILSLNDRELNLRNVKTKSVYKMLRVE